MEIGKYAYSYCFPFCSTHQNGPKGHRKMFKQDLFFLARDKRPNALLKQTSCGFISVWMFLLVCFSYSIVSLFSFIYRCIESVQRGNFEHENILIRHIFSKCVYIVVHYLFTFECAFVCRVRGPGKTSIGSILSTLLQEYCLSGDATASLENREERHEQLLRRIKIEKSTLHNKMASVVFIWVSYRYYIVLTASAVYTPTISYKDDCVCVCELRLMLFQALSFVLSSNNIWQPMMVICVYLFCGICC